MVPNYLVCEGISVLGFLCVYVDNEDVRSYTKQEESSQGASCVNSNAFPMHRNTSQHVQRAAEKSRRKATPGTTDVREVLNFLTAQQWDREAKKSGLH